VNLCMIWTKTKTEKLIFRTNFIWNRTHWVLRKRCSKWSKTSRYIYFQEISTTLIKRF